VDKAGKKYRTEKILIRSGAEPRQTVSFDSVHYKRRTRIGRRGVVDRRKLQAQKTRRGESKENFFKSLFRKYTRKKPYLLSPTEQRSDLPVELDRLEAVGRTEERKNCQISAFVEDSYTRVRRDATICNFSHSGMYLESEHALQVGIGAMIHMSSYSSDASPPENLKKYFAQVVWVNKIAGKRTFNRYGIGVKFCTSLDEFTRLFWM